MSHHVSTTRRSWPPPVGDGSTHTFSGLPLDGTHVDVDGWADYNIIGIGGVLCAVSVMDQPHLCSSCGALIDPLTSGCRC